MMIVPETIFSLILFFMRYHEFIWSVFATKLIFDIFGILVTSVSMCIVKLAVDF